MIGIIGAMQIEVDNLLKEMKDKNTTVISGIKYIHGTLCGKEVVVAKCGIGKVFAALCAQTMIIKYTPEIIINTGVSGGIASQTNIGDVIIAENVVQHDMDTSAIGDPAGLILGIDLIHIPCSRNVVVKLDKVLSTMDRRHKIGTIATGDKFISDTKETQRINDLFGAIAFDMESASIGQVCYVNGVDYGIIRSISDNGSEEAGEDFNQFAQKAAKVSAGAVKEFLKNLE